MSVHQVEEFYVYKSIPESKRKEVRILAIAECWDYSYDEGELTVESLYSIQDAEDCECMINEVLLSC
tara:strand:+ start:513 stop:713 length:201 start_codon:yes stop_codon:yes gene_type:complete